MINLELLSKLMDHDPRRVDMFIGIFKSDVPDQLERLHTALVNSNSNDASILAHTIKSQCKYMGLEEIADLAYTLEKEATADKAMSELIPIYTELNEQLRLVIQELP